MCNLNVVDRIIKAVNLSFTLRPQATEVFCGMIVFKEQFALDGGADNTCY